MSSVCNKQDTDVSTPTQQVQEFAQTQDPLLVVLPQSEQNTIVLQLDSKQPHGKPINSILIGVAIALIAVGAAVCVLNITATIKGPWSSIFGVIMASTGVVIPLIRPYIHRRELAAKITIYLGQVTEIDLR